MGMNKFAKDNDLARKFESAIESIRVGKGWSVFDGLDKGPITVTVIYDGGIRFMAVKKPKKAKKTPKEPEPEPEVPEEPETEDKAPEPSGDSNE